MARGSGCAVLLVSADDARRDRATRALLGRCEILHASEMSSALDELSLGGPLVVLIDAALPRDQVTGLLGTVGGVSWTVLWGEEFSVELLEHGALVQIPYSADDKVLASAIATLADQQRAYRDQRTQRERAARFERVMDTVELVRQEANSPLTAIMAEAELLLTGGGDLTAEQRSSLETIEAMARRIRDLIAQLHELGADE